MLSFYSDDAILKIVLVLLMAIAISIPLKSYLIAIAPTAILMGLNNAYGLSAMSQVLTLVLGLIAIQFIRRRKQIERAEKEIYETGRETAKWSKIFDRGFDDEYQK